VGAYPARGGRRGPADRVRAVTGALICRPMQTTPLTGTIHLVRHGEVENPKGVVYGRLPGYNLSLRGQQQAIEAGEHLARANVGVISSSPLERAQETAQAIAVHHGLEVATDERFIESATTFEGIGRSLWSFATSPRHWWRLRNPWAPSWGESFAEMRKRMLEGIADALESARGREIVVVSHQTPVLVTRLALARRSVPPWIAGVPCQTGSVTTMVVEDGRIVRGSYFVPAA
jgi:broad specificity phosphatase PhoE